MLNKRKRNEEQSNSSLDDLDILLGNKTLKKVVEPVILKEEKQQLRISKRPRTDNATSFNLSIPKVKEEFRQNDELFNEAKDIEAADKQIGVDEGSEFSFSKKETAVLQVRDDMMTEENLSPYVP